jgi:hypothetical protein
VLRQKKRLLPYAAISQAVVPSVGLYGGNAIDKDGAVYGVCRGSAFAFNPRYYAEHRLPPVDDIHGIGIVLLAGIKWLKIRPPRQGAT